jgi:carbonic anhydrase
MPKRWLDEILEKNEAYASKPDFLRQPTTGLPGQMALVTCMDPRVNLEAVGVRPKKEGEPVERVILTRGGVPDMASLFVLLYVGNMKEVAFMTHTDCGLTKIQKDPGRAVARMKERLGEEGFKRAKALMGGEPLEKKILNWLDTFEDPREEVKRRVENFKNHPLVPPDVIAHGLLLDLATGKVEVVVNGYEN